jgi:hypothetical protein
MLCTRQERKEDDREAAGSDAAQTVSHRRSGRAVSGNGQARQDARGGRLVFMVCGACDPCLKSAPVVRGEGGAGGASLLCAGSAGKIHTVTFRRE